jgi:adenosylcobinamide-phosphate synthase
MSFFAILFALLIEQVRPLGAPQPHPRRLRAWARWSSRNFDAGKPQHGWIAWGSPWGPRWRRWPSTGCWCCSSAGRSRRWCGAWRCSTSRWASASSATTSPTSATRSTPATRPLARELLAHWQQVDAAELPRSEIVRHVIEYSVLAAHRHVFGVLAWFSVLAAFGFGPAGAVLYRMSEFVTRYWRYRSQPRSQPASEALQLAADQGLGRHRLAAGAHHGHGVRHGGQLRGGDRLLAQPRAALPERQRRRDPGRHLGRGERAPGRRG